MANAAGAQRRTWDLELYERRARERVELGDEKVEGDVDDRPIRDREEFQRAEDDMQGPAGSSRAFLKLRSKNLQLDNAAGKTQIITDSGLRQKGGGWWCDVCQCLLKDSANYLDHINGKKHQRKLGFSMRVERSSVSQVANAFQHAKKRKEEEMAGITGPSAVESYESRIQARRDDQARLKKSRKEIKAAKKREEQVREFEDIDPDIAEAMGFGGFGGSSKK